MEATIHSLMTYAAVGGAEALHHLAVSQIARSPWPDALVMTCSAALVKTATLSNVDMTTMSWR